MKATGFDTVDAVGVGVGFVVGTRDVKKRTK